MSRNNAALPLLSILIPTRNRIPYAKSAIQSILEIPEPRLELVIQDNSDSRDLETWIHDHIGDARLRYHYTEQPLSFVHNFDVAAGLATGEYICFIGDDDGVNPEIIEAASWAKSEDLDALAVTDRIYYLWSGTGVASTLFTKKVGGSLYIKDFSGSLLDADMEKELRSLVRNGGLYYLESNLPKLYHGLVHRRCLQAVHEKTGAYFGGLTPDTFASLAISCVAKRVVVADYPLTIPGLSKSSGSVVEGTIKRHSKKLEDAPHLRYRGDYLWCEMVPPVYTVETLWVDSSLAALTAMGRNDLVQQLNLPKLSAYCIGNNRGVTWIVLRDLVKKMRMLHKNLFVGALQFALSLVTGPGLKFARRVVNRFLLIIGVRSIHRIDGLENLSEASHALTLYLREHGKSFADCVQRRNQKSTLSKVGGFRVLPQD